MLQLTPAIQFQSRTGKIFPPVAAAITANFPVKKAENVVNPPQIPAAKNNLQLVAKLSLRNE